jgi:hypothetical protein
MERGTNKIMSETEVIGGRWGQDLWKKVTDGWRADRVRDRAKR